MNVASLHRVSKAFDGRMVLENVTLSIAAGEAVGVIGPNGSGKTTLLRILLGLVHPDAGAVRIRGREPARGLVNQRVAYFAGGSTLPDQVRVRQWARLFDVGGDPVRDERRFRALSRGQRQVIGLQVALGVSLCISSFWMSPGRVWIRMVPSGCRWRYSASGGMVPRSSSHLIGLPTLPMSGAVTPFFTTGRSSTYPLKTVLRRRWSERASPRPTTALPRVHLDGAVC